MTHIENGINTDRALLRMAVAPLPTVVRMGNPPQPGEQYAWVPKEQWRNRVAQVIHDAASHVNHIDNPALRERLRGIVHLVLAELRPLKNSTLNDHDRSLLLKTAIARVSRIMAEEFRVNDSELSEIEEHAVSLDELIKMYPNRFKEAMGELNGIPVRQIHVMSHDYSQDAGTGAEYGYINVPSNPAISLKGGDPRVILKAMIAEEMRGLETEEEWAKRENTIRAEFPASDMDCIIEEGDQAAYAEAVHMGISKDGIEIVPRDLSFRMLAASRDIGPNQAFINSNRLRYSNIAYDQLRSGVATVTAHYVPEKALYNSDRMMVAVVDEDDKRVGTQIVDKPRACARMLKFLTTGKIQSFEFLEANGKLFDVGLYSMFLADKWVKRPNFGDHAQKIFHILKQMDQVNPGETIEQYLTRAHETYPFFQFDSSLSTEEEVLEWLLRKFAKQIDREAGWAHGLSGGVNMSIKASEAGKMKRLSLDGYEEDPAISAGLTAWKSQYIEECKARTMALGPQTDYERLFFGRAGYDEEDIAPCLGE